MKGKDIFSNLGLFFSRYSDDTAVTVLARRFRRVLDDTGGPEPLRLIYEEALSVVEKNAAETGFREDILRLQRGLYRELEQVLSFPREDLRHNFLIVVPVADRPLMLMNCLASLAAQCRIFGYGGSSPGDEGRPSYRKVSVLVVDDSKDSRNARQIREITEEMKTVGVRASYVGLTEQTRVLKKIRPEFREELHDLIGDFGGGVKPHKGASLTRNIAYLYIKSRLEEFPEKTLIWFLDSDEEFMVKVKTAGKTDDVPFINYFYWLDRIFTVADTEVLTGKVVGDPPVTPSVMINTFLDDIIMFFDNLKETDPHGRCPFHDDHAPAAFSAEYHDMGGLFGYTRPTLGKKYLCGLTGNHSTEDCVEDFSKKMLGFFCGFHPTRTQFYLHLNSFMESQNARTVYTGNYVITPEGLRHFIPFAGLGLRMAGPTLGRILRKRLNNRFISSNLPLLHTRTITEKYTEEFRAGVIKGKNTLDVSGEFQRQFWGDVMLFSVEALTEKGYPETLLDIAEIRKTVGAVQNKIWDMYSKHQASVSDKLGKIKACLSDQDFWGGNTVAEKNSLRNFTSFCSLVEKNFGPGSAVMGRISEQLTEATYTKKISDAIHSFYIEDRSWNELLKAFPSETKMD